jgi:pyrophosphatase PpaX
MDRFTPPPTPHAKSTTGRTGGSLSSNSIKIVLFDFDGTLVDSIEAARATTSEVIATVGVAGLTLAELLYAMRFDTYNRMSHHTGITDPEVLTRLSRTFYERLIEHPERVHPREDAIRVCRDLADRGIKLGIVSNNRSDMIQRVLSYHTRRWPNLADLFPLIIGEDTVDPPKPDPKGLRLAMKRFGVEETQTVYVGDGPSDAIAAKRAGVRSIGVGWAHKKYGLKMPEEFDETIDSIEGLTALIS